jgi:protein O-GlcNAc transferase
MKKIISFSLWGDNPKYTVGAIKNADLALDIYPDWICRFYIGKSTPISIVNELKMKSNTEIIKMNEDGDWNSMFWRFLPISEDDTDIMISRDCDSRLSNREKQCVYEFIESDKMFHTMIDHPFHGGIMGGMWGCKKGILKEMKEYINNWNKTNNWQTDQSFLNTIIAPIVSDTILVHDSINLKNFTTQRENYHYVGEPFESNEDRSEHWSVFTFPEFSGCV